MNKENTISREIYDVVIIGGGPAGLTASIYASRYGMKNILIARDIGGMAGMAEKIENYPGFEGSGKKLMTNFYKQAKKFGTEFLNDDIISLQKERENLIVAVAGKKLIRAKSIIIALGTQRRKLNIEGEDKLLGKGVSYCATCDGFFFKRKDVAIIGSGDSACKAALLLSAIAKRVYMVYKKDTDKCEAVYGKKMKARKNIVIYNNSSPLEIKGKESVEGLVFWKDNKEQLLKVQGVFIEIGGLPVSDICKMLNIQMDSEGYIHVDSEMKTDVSGVFAAGDVVKSNLKQIVVAASQGAMAAKSAFDFVKSL